MMLGICISIQWNDNSIFIHSKWLTVIHFKRYHNGEVKGVTYEVDHHVICRLLFLHWANVITESQELASSDEEAADPGIWAYIRDKLLMLQQQKEEEKHDVEKQRRSRKPELIKTYMPRADSFSTTGDCFLLKPRSFSVKYSVITSIKGYLDILNKIYFVVFGKLCSRIKYHWRAYSTTSFTVPLLLW